jgi:DNA repair protein RadB
MLSAVLSPVKILVQCKALDDLLGGGIESGCVTLLYGEAGSGKTNICLQLARNVAREERKVIFIDTEGVSLERLQQICGDDFEVIVKRILFSEPYTIDDQEKIVEKTLKLVEKNKDIGIVILDSATTHFRVTLRNEEREDRRSLTRQVTMLMQMAREMNLPVVLTSQVYTDIETGEYMPLGGHMLTHNAKVLVRLQKVSPNVRRAVIIKHRHIEEQKSATFRLTARGVE